MAGRSAWDVDGVVVQSQRNRRELPAIALQVARRNAILLQAVAVEAPDLDRLIPPVLRSVATSWLVLHPQQDDTDVLVVPFPVDLAEAPDAVAANSPFSMFLETIRGERNARWFAATGYRNLAAAARGGRLPEQVRVFEAVHLPVGLWDVIRGVQSAPDAERRPAVAPKLIEGLTRLVQKVTGDRAALRDAINADASREASQAREAYDNQLLEHAEQLVRTLGDDESLGRPLDLSFLPAAALELLDPESRRFLETSRIVEAAAVQSGYEDFDFAAAACPLWKLIERELNLSVGWLIRLLREVASGESPWRPRADLDPLARVRVQTGEHPGQEIELNERNVLDQGLLRGLMLGPIRYLLGYGAHNGLRAEILSQAIGGDWPQDRLDTFLFSPRRGSLAKTVAKVIGLRNEHAHVKAMSRKEFDAIKKTVLGRLDDAHRSLLVHVLTLKAAIHAFVERTHDGATEIRPRSR